MNGEPSRGGLREHQRGEHLRVLDDERAGRRGRAGGPAHHARGHARRLAEPRPAHEQARRLAGELQRRVGVQDDQGARAARPLRAVQDLVERHRHVEVVVHAGDPLDRLVAQRQTRVGAAARAQLLGQIDAARCSRRSARCRARRARAWRRGRRPPGCLGAHRAAVEDECRCPRCRAEHRTSAAAARGIGGRRTSKSRAPGRRPASVNDAGASASARCTASSSKNTRAPSARSPRDASSAHCLGLAHQHAGPREDAERGVVDGGDVGVGEHRRIGPRSGSALRHEPGHEPVDARRELRRQRRRLVGLEQLEGLAAGLLAQVEAAFFVPSARGPRG